MTYFDEIVPTKVTIYDAGGAFVAETDIPKDNDSKNTVYVMLEVANPVLWNAEMPYLYTLVIQNGERRLRTTLGFARLPSWTTWFCLMERHSNSAVSTGMIPTRSQDLVSVWGR